MVHFMLGCIVRFMVGFSVRFVVGFMVRFIVRCVVHFTVRSIIIKPFHCVFHAVVVGAFHGGLHGWFLGAFDDSSLVLSLFSWLVLLVRLDVHFMAGCVVGFMAGVILGCTTGLIGAHDWFQERRPANDKNKGSLGYFSQTSPGWTNNRKIRGTKTYSSLHISRSAKHNVLSRLKSLKFLVDTICHNSGIYRPKNAQTCPSTTKFCRR